MTSNTSHVGLIFLCVLQVLALRKILAVRKIYTSSFIWPVSKYAWSTYLLLIEYSFVLSACIVNSDEPCSKMINLAAVCRQKIEEDTR